MLRIERQGSIVIWTIDRPGQKNALDHATFVALGNAARAANEDASVRAVVLTGAGNVFVSGGDLQEMREKLSREDAESFSDLGYDTFGAIAECRVPVIAALPGPAIGGGAELALACDLRIADSRARFSFKHVRMGVTTAWGTVPRLVAAVGRSTAARLLYTAHDVPAAEALRIGLADAVTDDGQALATALAWGNDISQGSPAAMAFMKKLLANPSSRQDRDFERHAFVETWSGADHHEAVKAYFERRQPKF